MLLTSGSHAGMWRTVYAQLLTTSSVALTAIGITTVFNVAQLGIIEAIALRVTTAVTGTVPTVSLQILLDSQATVTPPIYSAALTWDPTIIPFQTLGNAATPGSNIGDCFKLPVMYRFLSTAQIKLNVQTAAGTAGVVQLSVLAGVAA